MPPRWAFFSSAVMALLAVSLWQRATAPVRGEPVRSTRPNSIAVLPFANASPDSAEDYLGYGVATELTRALDHVPGLRVAARSSTFGLKRRLGDPRLAGRRLNVATLLQGSIRRSGGRLRVTARLVDVEEGFDLWSETYERTPGDLLAIQDEIRKSVAATLRPQVLRDSASEPARLTASVPAYDSYLAGKYLLDQLMPGSVPRAIPYLTRAVRLDTNFAQAYVALAEAYMHQGHAEALAPVVRVPMAQAAAERALELDSTLSRPHVTLGTIRFSYDRNWRAAEAEFRRAIALEPGSPDAYHAYSHLLLAVGRIDESLEASERALQLSPAAPDLTQHLGWHYLHARQYGRARETLLRAVDLDSTAWGPHLDMALLEQVTGNYPEAEAHLRIPLQVAPQRPEVQVALGQVHALSGRNEEALARLEWLRDAAEERYISPYLLACLQGALGQRNQAFVSLNRAVRDRSELVAYLRIDPRLDSLRTDRRFSRLLRQIRLP
ncbi:MAG: TPR end-of-group domain-containing protein [Gemmatimonadales bacterium]